MNKLIKAGNAGKFFFIKFFLLLGIVFCVNLWLRKSAPITYAKLVNYNQLYFDKDKIHIKSFHLTENFLKIDFEGSQLEGSTNDFKVFSGKELLYETGTEGKEIKFIPPKTGINRLAVVINGGPDTVFMNVDYGMDRLNRSAGSNPVPLYEVTTHTLVEEGQLYGFKDWAIDYWGEDTVHSERETNQILTDSANIVKEDNSLQKVLKIARFILFRTAGKEGMPSKELSRMPPLEQLNYVEAGKSKLWCGNFSSIFSFLAASAGLPVRIVSCGLSEGRYATGIHVFCEVFIKEDQSWVYVDLTSRNLLVRYNKKWLNVVDIQRLLRYPVQDTSFKAWHYEKDSLFETPFYKVADLAEYYFYPNAVFTFYYGDFIKIMNPGNLFRRGEKFFYTKPYYALYSDNSKLVNNDFYLRLITNYLLGFLLLFGLFRISKGFHR
jgi:hypothetical protein